MSTLTKYEKNALKEIHTWKEPDSSWFGQALKVINQPLDKAGELLFNAPGVGPAIRGAVEGLTSVCHDAAQWSVRPEAIFEEFRNDGHTKVTTHKDIHDLELEQIDKVVGFLGAKYKGLALVEGAGAGAVGIAGLAVDIPTLITLNLRAIGEYAAYYGFDTSRQEERLFAFNVLGLASSPTDSSKALAMAQLIKISQDVAKKATWQELEKSAFVKIIQEIAKALGIRLTKAKLAQAIPALGAAVGGGFNAYFTMKVCDAAFYLYRERFLAQKHGADVIDVTVKPANDYAPNYAEASQAV
ncbi:EcsC family protein [Pantoea sp. Tr-811]|uniref:EcsC family protein n=1 Tax=Pantoea sp. Tr-811 TaxID=2608361 RepID=UPI001421CF07|nr:EcsC family protein [Pantoea sp. Tr-811]NIF27661.1 EcsC family protein [Pantoea sp. Tr-811]